MRSPRSCCVARGPAALGLRCTTSGYALGHKSAIMPSVPCVIIYFTIQLSATRHAICDSCDKKLPVASCHKLSQAVAMHLSQKLKKVQLLRHATRDIHKWSTVSTLGARAQYNCLRRDTRFATVATRNCLSRAVASCRNAPVAEVEESSTFATRDIHKWSTVSTLGARAVHVHSTTCA